MKFADHLRESTISEWKGKYIDYKYGKKKLKKYKANTAKLNIPAVGYVSGRGTPKKKYNDFQVECINDFIEDWLIPNQLYKCNEFYLWLLSQCQEKYLILSQQLDCYREHKKEFREISSRVTYQTSSTSVLQAYGSISNAPEEDIEEDPELSFKKHDNMFQMTLKHFLNEHDLMPSWPKMFIETIPEALKPKSINTKLKETFAYSNKLNLNLNLMRNKDEHGNKILKNPHKELKHARALLSDALLEFYLFLQLVKSYRDVNVVGFRKIVKKFDKTCKTQELAGFMRFVRANYTIFKHDAVSTEATIKASKAKTLTDDDIGEDSSTITDTNVSLTSTTIDPLRAWEAKLTKWYTVDVVNSLSEKKRHLEKLKKVSIQYSLNEQMIHRNNRAILQMTVFGVFTGIAVTLIAYTLYLAFLSPLNTKRHKILFPIWGGWYMILLISLFFLIDCFIWHRTGINYRFIMFGEVQAKSGTQFFNNDFATTGIPLRLYFLAFFIISCAIISALSFHFDHLTPYGYIYFIVVGLLFITPYDLIPYWDKLVETRKFLVTTTFRLVLSGLYPVEFKDFFLGDIICSLTYTLSDLAIFACYYAPKTRKDPLGMCGSSHSKAMGVLSCLPSFWRFMQCVRRFFDSNDWFPHLPNAAKYLLGVAYNATLCAYRLSNHSPAKRNPFIIFATLNSISTSIWDLVMDWSVLQSSIGNENLFLRKDLYLAGKRNWETGKYDWSRKAVYYIAMVLDVVIRFQWIVYAVAPQTIQQSAVTSFALAVTEVCRRFIWVIFRVENEHVANVHLFRVTGEALLPYPNQDVVDFSGKATTDLYDDQHFQQGRDSIESSRPSHLHDLDLSLSDINNKFEEPTATYHSIVRRRTAIFDNISRSIPWAHAKDFQRPLTQHNGESSKTYESDSESEGESIA
ncbi:hypothetical protein B1J92_L00737g [Nakaseomyces glabratus]|nr:hypothetical protein B1J91_L00737g [Nakaseomyces glabratus]OXB47699.1 hypothetical protein B1J92_L00737g [Nakaseomyces glabratus]